MDVPIRFRSFVSVFPNTLKRRSHVAELVETERRRVARRRNGVCGSEEKLRSQ